jgi:hypothetical protein
MPEAIEPKTTNRFKIDLIGINIPDYLFRKYKIYNDGSKIMFETSFFESIHYTFNPSDFFNIKSVKLQQVDATGVCIGGLTFDVKNLNFSNIGDYGKDELLTYHFIFEVKIDTIKPIFFNN